MSPEAGHLLRDEKARDGLLPRVDMFQPPAMKIAVEDTRKTLKELLDACVRERSGLSVQRECYFVNEKKDGAPVFQATRDGSHVAEGGEDPPMLSQETDWVLVLEGRQWGVVSKWWYENETLPGRAAEAARQQASASGSTAGEQVAPVADQPAEPKVVLSPSFALEAGILPPK